MGEALQKGSSHCEIDGKVEKLSFVFVASRRKTLKLEQDLLTTTEIRLAEVENSLTKKKDILKDSSKNFFVIIPGTTPNDFDSNVPKIFLNKLSSISTQGMIPAYLVVFNEINNK